MGHLVKGRFKPVDRLICSVKTKLVRRASTLYDRFQKLSTDFDSPKRRHRYLQMTAYYVKYLLISGQVHGTE